MRPHFILHRVLNYADEIRFDSNQKVPETDFRLNQALAYVVQALGILYALYSSNQVPSRHPTGLLIIPKRPS